MAPPSRGAPSQASATRPDLLAESMSRDRPPFVVDARSGPLALRRAGRRLPAPADQVEPRVAFRAHARHLGSGLVRAGRAGSGSTTDCGSRSTSRWACSALVCSDVAPTTGHDRGAGRLNIRRRRVGYRVRARRSWRRSRSRPAGGGARSSRSPSSRSPLPVVLDQLNPAYQRPVAGDDADPGRHRRHLDRLGHVHRVTTRAARTLCVSGPRRPSPSKRHGSRRPAPRSGAVSPARCTTSWRTASRW